MGIRSWIRGLFLRPKIEPLPISFVMDTDQSGKQIVQLFRHIDGRAERIRDISSLLRYGYQEVSSDGRTVYVLDESERQAMLAMKSLNPDLSPDGSLRFDVNPSVLRYLRNHESVQETSASQKITVSDKPIRPKAEISFDGGSDLVIRTGFALGDEWCSGEDVLQNNSSGFVRVGQALVELPRTLSERAHEFLGAEMIFITEDEIPEFFTRDLVLIKNDFNAVLLDRAGEIQILRDTFTPVVSVDKQQGGWLDFDVGFQTHGRRISHRELQNIPPTTSGDQYLRADETTWIMVDDKTVADVDRKMQDLQWELTDEGYRLPVAQFASLEEFIQHIGGTAELSAAYQAFQEQLTGFVADPNFRLEDSIEGALTSQGINLRPYQRSGIHWLTWLQEHYLHGLLADDMGLGKTIQSICAMTNGYLATGSDQHSLVVAPRSVLLHWQREIERVYPEARICIYHGARRYRLHRLFESDKPIIFISTYETVSNDTDVLAGVPFFYLILDEATFIKNPQAKRTGNIKMLNAAHRIGLSGTPVENRPAELWSIFDFLMRGHLGRFGTFKRTFEKPILDGDQVVANALGNRIRPFMLRRVKSEVAQDLPEKIEINEWCGLTEEQAALYQGKLEEIKEVRVSLERGEKVDYTASILPVLTWLKQVCDHPAIVTNELSPLAHRSEKFDMILQKLKINVHFGEQSVVFSHFLGMLDLIQTALQEADIAFIRIDGSTQNRQQLIDRFNEGYADVALCSLRAAGQGINLTSANHVIHADRWWNPAAEDQATDRVHRIGQEKTVYVHRILTEGTLEERIDSLLAEKRAIANQIVGAANKRRLQWTREELLEILRPLE